MGRIPTVAGGFSDSLAQLVTKMKQYALKALLFHFAIVCSHFAFPYYSFGVASGVMFHKRYLHKRIKASMAGNTSFFSVGTTFVGTPVYLRTNPD